MKTHHSMKSLSRAISIVKCFSTSEPELTGADIVRKVEIPKPTVYRILTCLTENGLLEKSVRTGKYKIGPEFYVLGSLYLSTTDFLKAAEPVTKTLNDLTGEAICISILDRGNVIIVLKEESKYAFRFALNVGSVLPAYVSSIGRALLSELTEEELDNLYPEEKLLPQTKKSITTKTELKLKLDEVRKTGVSVSIEEGYEECVGIASSIRCASSGGKAVAGMSITIPAYKFNQDSHERLAILVKLGSSLISYRLGYQDMVNQVRDIEEIRSWWEQSQSDSASQANNSTQAVPISYGNAVEEEIS